MSPLHNRNILKLAIENSKSTKEVIQYLGLSSSGNTYKHVRNWAEKHGLELPQYDLSKSTRKIRTLDEKLKKGVLVQSNKLLVQLVAEGLKTNECEICGQNNIWNGKPLTLHLDHIDGDHSNNLIDNLRVLCPHCHQQTPTYGAKNIKIKPTKKHFCLCGKEKTRDAIDCFDCYSSNKKTLIRNSDIPWPPIEEILHSLETLSFLQLGKTLGVSDNAVRKYIKRNGFEVPRRKRKMRLVPRTGFEPVYPP